ncbi:MAG: hypothetical protein EYC70_02865 [Planctomycetota bacterium]|nr:MAG: hypothetical protein EYC70_02865 [Planctomycetota bacterium]
MSPSNYFAETKYCPRCNEYVRYLMSLQTSYCVRCGSKVHLFSRKDQDLFLRSLDGSRGTGRQHRKKGA